MGWIRSKPHRKCPICGGGSWCSWINGNEPNTWFVVCMRVATGSIGQTTLRDSGATGYRHIVDNLECRVTGEIDVSQTTPIANIEQRDQVYRTLCTGELNSYHYNYLKARGYDEDTINYLRKECLLTSITPYDDPVEREAWVNHLVSKISLKGVPGFWNTKANEWKFSVSEGILIPVKTELNKIVGCQVASNESIFAFLQKKRGIEYDSKSPKYFWLSSAPYADKNPRTGASFIKRRTGVSADPIPHAMQFKQNVLDPVINCLYVVEGVLKSDIISYLYEQPTMGQPGVGIGTAKVAKVSELAKDVVIGYDADWRTNDLVKGALVNLVCTIGKLRSLSEVYVAVWPEDKGKGLDDVWLNGNGKFIEYQEARYWLKENVIEIDGVGSR